MKTFTTTLLLVLSSGLMMAYPSASRLTVELIGHRNNSMIVINGQRYSATNNLVQLNGLMAGDYPVQVLRPTHWGDQGVVFSGVIRVPQRSMVTAVIGQQGMKVQASPLAHAGGSYWDNDHHGHGQGGTHYQNPNGNGGFVSLLLHPQPVQPIVCAPPMIGMHPDVFEGALRRIDAATFDSDQLIIAKQIIRMNGASSFQIAEIMRLFSFESSRLEIAKFGYRFVGDPHNYYVVNDVFWFSSSIRELDRFIGNFN